MWSTLPQITASSLKTNIGFHLACSYWALYFGLGLCAIATDRKFMRDKKIKLLYEATHKSSNSLSELDLSGFSDPSTCPV